MIQQQENADIYFKTGHLCYTIEIILKFDSNVFFRLYKPLSMLLRWNLKENIDRGKRNFLI